MLIKIKKSSTLKESELTSETLYQSRRDWLKTFGIAAASAAFTSRADASILDLFRTDSTAATDVVFARKALSFSKSEQGNNLLLTPEDKILSYNNFYEFGSSKYEPAQNSQAFSVDPWRLDVTGLVNKPLTLSYDELLTRFPLEERFYRLRCVEAWSMNIPWIGFPLASLLKVVQPLGSAKYVAFETLYDPKQMIGQRSLTLGGGIDFPYVEGLRLDEAMHDLTLLSVGLYGKTLAPQNGAPIRLVVPWKYGFKSIKSIVKIHLLEAQPPSTWNKLAPKEYGFYSNVNPKVDHPRWSQSSERFIGEGSIFGPKRQPTLLFNGYDEVASLYEDMDLKKYY